MYKINKDKTILPKTTLVYDIQHVPKDDSFRSSKKGKFVKFIFIIFITLLDLVCLSGAFILLLFRFALFLALR